MLVGFVLFTAATGSALFDRDPFDAWFLPTALWSLILIVDGWVHRQRGESLLISYPARVLFLGAWSLGFWGLFELANLRLGSWRYHLPVDFPAPALFFTLTFAAVVPALFEAADLLDSARLVRERPLQSLGRTLPREGWYYAVGAALLLLPLLWPHRFFPLIWGGVFLLADPWNERLGATSILEEVRIGRWKRVRLLMAAGLGCGFLRELLNWDVLGRLRWTYDLPGMETRVFELPALGYLAFPVFALSLFSATVTAVTVWQGARRGGKALLAVAWLAVGGAAVSILVARVTTAP
jgi:hypothetical protein